MPDLITPSGEMACRNWLNSCNNASINACVGTRPTTDTVAGLLMDIDRSCFGVGSCRECGKRLNSRLKPHLTERDMERHHWRSREFCIGAGIIMQ